MSATPPTFDAAVARHFRHNFMANLLDGALFYAGYYAFFSERTILPVFLSRLTDSPLALGLLAAIPPLGIYLPQLFTARWVERLPRKLPYLVITSLLTERLAPILTALVAWKALGLSRDMAVVLFLLTLFHFNFGAGMVATAWQDMLAKVIPIHARGRFFGLTNSIGSGLAFALAVAAGYILSRYPFPTNFAICFAIGSVGIFVSWFALVVTREPPLPDTRPPVSWASYFRSLPDIVRHDANFRRFLITRSTGMLATMGTGFIAAYAVRRLALPDESAGAFTALLLAGQIVANLVLGMLADRHGHKLTLELSVAAQALAFVAALLATSIGWFYLAFVLQGVAAAGLALSGISITMELGPVASRPTYIGLSNSILGIFGTLAPILGGIIAARAGYPALFAVSALISLVAVALWQWWVQEPRRLAAGPPAA